jgi:hypothetical protein
MNPLLYSRFQEEIGSNQIELASDIIESERAIKSEILGCLILVRCIMAAINTQADALVKILDSIMKTESC